MSKSADPQRDIVFVPIGVNYDRVLEDRNLIKTRLPGYEAPKGWRTLLIFAAAMLRGPRHYVRGQWLRYGHAQLSFGSPMSLRESL